MLNCVVLWNTVYMDAALKQLRAHGYPVADDDIVRLSAFVYAHINVHGAYTFTPVTPRGGLRPFRDPDTPHDG